MIHSTVGRAALAGALALAFAGTAAPVLAQTRLLVVEKAQGNLAMVDPATRQVLWRTPTGPDSHEVIASPDGKRAFVSNYGGPGGTLHTIAVVDLTTGKTLAPIDTAPLFSPHGLAVSDGKLIFTAETSKAVARYDLTANKIDWVMGTAQDRTHIVAIGPERSLVTGNAASASISIITPSQLLFAGTQRPNYTVTTIPTGDGTQGVDVTPDGRFAWVAASRAGVVSVVDLAAKKVVETVPLPWKLGNRLKISPDGRTALIAATQLAAIDIASKQVRTLDIGPAPGEGILITPDSRTAYVALPLGNRVAVIDLTSFTLSGYIDTGASPDGLAWVP